VLQVDPNTVPGGRATAHLIDQDIGGLEQLCDARMPLFPFG
jgi:hypothetical protein